MNRFATSFIVMLLAVSLTGCGKTSSAQPDQIAVGPVQPTIQIPPEYAVLAEIMAFEMKLSPDDFQDSYSDAEFLADVQSSIMRLEGIKSDDADIASLAKSGLDMLHDGLARKERIDSLPLPAGLGTQFLKGFMAGVYAGGTGDVFSAVSVSVGDLWNESEKQEAIRRELEHFAGFINKLDAMHMMLPVVAQKYAAPASDVSRVSANIDESWEGFGPHDWIRLYNSGPDHMESCTIQIVLKGNSGQSRKNVHFVRHWPANSWLHARYGSGRQFSPNGQVVGRTTVDEIQNMEISIWSPTFTTNLKYAYQGQEKDKDIAKLCTNLSFTGKYKPFRSGYLWNTERGVDFTMAGMESLPGCHIDVTFRKDWTSRKLSWDRDSWAKGETKSFTPARGKLTFDPTHIDLKLSFPGTDYQHKTTLKVQ